MDSRYDSSIVQLTYIPVFIYDVFTGIQHSRFKTINLKGGRLWRLDDKKGCQIGTGTTMMRKGIDIYIYDIQSIYILYIFGILRTQWVIRRHLE